MKIVKLLAVVLILAGGAYGVKGYMATAEISKRGSEEVKAQEAELTQCKDRLKLLYAAWDAYRKDHKGSEPPTIDSLVPKYVKDGDMLACPTFQRWSKAGRPLSKGEISIEGRKASVSYGFQWLIGSSGTVQKKLKDKAPLVLCESHREAAYTAAYKKSFDAHAFDESEATSLVGPVKSSPILAVRRDGTVGEIDPAEYSLAK
jgi:hypothetical protein